MKKVLQFTMIFLLMFSAAVAQNVPQGMQYQAVARDLSGNILANQEISLKISLVGSGKSVLPYYTEMHKVTTNQLGLFALVIGAGKAEKGTFSSVPWSTDEVWMQVNIKEKNSALYKTISNSKLLAVPYAFHAGTASQIVGNAGSAVGISSNSTPTPSNTWKTSGNLKTDAESDYLGNYDAVDLVIKTNNTERIRVAATTGDIKITSTSQSTSPTTGALVIVGGAGVGKNLNVGGNTNIDGSLNVNGSVSFKGASTFSGKLNVTDLTESTSPATGALTVAGGTGIAKNLNVGGTATVTGGTTLNNTLDVTGATRLKDAVIVDGSESITNITKSTNPTTGALTVAGGVGIGGDLNVAGSTKFGSVGASDISAQGLNIINNSATYIATFQNTNDGDGDGLKIKLGRAKSVFTIPVAPDPGAAGAFADLLNCKIPETQKVTTLANIVKDDLIETGKTMAGIAVSAGNMIIKVINEGLQLPLSIPDITVPDIHVSDAIDVTGPINSGLNLPIVLPALTVPAINFPALTTPQFIVHTPDGLPNFTFPGIKVTDGFTIAPALQLVGATTVMPKLPALTIPALNIPKTTLLSARTVMPKLPAIDLTSIGIPAIDISSLKFWGLDINICLDESTSSPLNNSNEFIRFADKNDAQVGSIRGVSVANWSANYLNPLFFNKLRGAFLSSKADKFHAQYHFKQEITTALATYAKIGVEYSSGNGDYAEWLERSDKMEVISAGDIVSVKGGKITKDLNNAEQVMVVSHAPIMLGNTPAADSKDLGNSIVFIGQAPVKIIGAVVSGDFIIGQISTPGYGIAKHPKDMTIDDFKLAVGRSWDTDESAGIKMANTVIGIHNSSFINLIKDLKEKADNNEARLKAIEAKLNLSPTYKKAATAAKRKK